MANGITSTAMVEAAGRSGMIGFFGAGGLTFFNGPSEPFQLEAQDRSDGRPSIAVLPFNNLSGEPDQDYFSDGMTEDLITDLSQVSGLFVLARNTTFAYKDRAVNVRDVGRDLGVTYVLEGSVRRAGERVRINAQLIDAETGGHVWAARYDQLQLARQSARLQLTTAPSPTVAAPNPRSRNRSRVPQLFSIQPHR